MDSSVRSQPLVSHSIGSTSSTFAFSSLQSTSATYNNNPQLPKHSLVQMLQSYTWNVHVLTVNTQKACYNELTSTSTSNTSVCHTACQSHGSTIFSRYSAVKASTSADLQSPVKQFRFINTLINSFTVVGVCQKCFDGYQACNLDMLWISHSTEDGLSGRCPAVCHFLASLLAVDEYMVSHHHSDNGCRCRHHHHHLSEITLKTI